MTNPDLRSKLEEILNDEIEHMMGSNGNAVDQLLSLIESEKATERERTLYKILGDLWNIRDLLKITNLHEIEIIIRESVFALSQTKGGE